MALHNTNGTGAPATTPTKLGQHYTDTSSGDAYLSTGIASAADWKLVQDAAALGTIATQDANAVAITGGSIVDLTELELPVSATPTVNSNGEIALDTTVADFSLGVVKFYGGEEQGIVSMPVAQFTAPSDGYVVRYNGTNDEFELAPGGSGSSFGKIVVSGQSDVDADTSSDTLTLAAGSNITLTTNAGTDTVTIAASGGNAFGTIAVSGQSDVVADSANDTLTLVAGSNITLTTSAGGDSVTIAASGGGGSSKYRKVFRPRDNEPPTTNFATLDTRNSHPVLDFDTTTQEAAIFSDMMSAGYGGGDITVAVTAALTSATSGTLGWDATFERVGTAQDIDSDSWATAQTVTATTVPGTSGFLLTLSVSITAGGAGTDSLAAGEAYRLRIRRDVTNDTAAGDAELWAVVVSEN